MKHGKSTKRALVLSILSVVMCLAMLIGTTFAWFTDTASTSVNTIQAGTLKLDVVDKEGQSLNGKTLAWQKAEDGAGQEILWEPGCTYELQPFQIVNKGNLALKYKVTISGVDGEAKLLEAIDFTVKIGDAEPVALSGWEGVLLPKGTAAEDDTDVETTQFITISGHMKEEAGNEYQELSIEGVAIQIAATQHTYEFDSNDNQYDKNATYPVVANNQQEVNDAITNAADKKATIVVPAGRTITLDNGIANSNNNDGKDRNITFTGDGNQTVDVVTNAVGAEGGRLNYQRGSSFTFENLTIQAGEGSFDGIVCDELVYRNCTIKGKLTLYGKATFINCTFENNMTNQYSIWTWGGTDVKFEGCTFNTNGKAILLYGQATESKPTNLVVNNCTFNDRNNGTAGKAAIEIGNDYNATYTLTVNNATVSGFADGKNTGSKVWANKNSMDAAHLTVTIDGAKVQ